MTKNRSLLITTATVLVAAAAAWFSAPACADDDVIAPSPGMNGLPDDNKTHWGLGVGVGVQRQPYAGIDSKTRALPLIFFENRYVRVLGLGADIKLPPAGPVSFALRVRYSGQGYDQSDAPILNGMDERKGALLAGGAALWRTGPYGIVSAELLSDVSGRSHGTQAKLGYDMPFRLGAFTLTPNVGAVLLDRKTVDYYYGVKSTEVRVGRPQYDGRRTVNTELGVRTGYALTTNQIVTLDLGATFFGSAIKDSPLVDRSNQTSLRLGYLYRF
jgi:outer membrane scaffolding protein for murein synthesis (MipA/OmpV family)